jgi:RES domain-containing protein
MINVAIYRIENKKRWNGQPEPPPSSPQARWNSGNRQVIYTAESASLAVLEKLKGSTTASSLGADVFFKQFVLWWIVLCLDQPPAEIDPAALPKDWWKVPAHRSIDTQRLGNTWLDRNDSLLLKVPSAAVPLGMGWNYLINPRYSDFKPVVQQAAVLVTDFDFQYYLS